MYEVIGHEGVRDSLKDVNDSFIVVGPPGVGKRGIVFEWAGDRDFEHFGWLNIVQARELAEKAYAHGNLTALIDGDNVKNWDPLLKPVEEGALKIAVYATKIHIPLASRTLLLAVGYLTEKQVLQILARDFPTFGPRPWLAKAAQGHFGYIKEAYAAIHVFEEINSCLDGRTFPKVVRNQPYAVFSCLKLASAAKVGNSNLPWTKGALDAIPRDVAWEVVKGPYPYNDHEARNVVNIFFAAVTNGRLG